MLRNALKVLAKPAFYFLVAGLLFGLGSYSTYYYLQKYTPPPAPISGVTNLEEGKSAEVDFSVFWDTWRVIQEEFVGRKNLNYQNLVWGAAKGLVQSLNDPYSSFFPPSDLKEFNVAITGKFEGIGIEIGIRKSVLTVIAPLEGTPAKIAGLKSGDQILKIDDALTSNFTLDEAVKRIRGPKDTTVTLSILRQGWSEPRAFPITRGVIDIIAVSWEPIDKDIAHLKLHSFNEKSFSEFRTKAQEIIASGRQNIILDLRNNPGGFLDASIYIAGWFLKKDEVVVKQNEGDGPFVCRSCRANGDEALLNHKIVILVNSGSASASEILAGALRDNRKIKLIGEKTFGKGSVQELKNLRGGTAIKVTVSKWLTPGEVDITEKGLEPDIEVKNPPENEKDLQLDKAKEIVRSL